MMFFRFKCSKFTIYSQLILLSILGLTMSCSGSYYGVNGNATYSREEAIDIITTAQVLRFTNCEEPEIVDRLVLETALTNPRLILDSAYYSKKDVRECQKAILITPCKDIFQGCQLGPEEFLNGRLFQGGF